LAWPDWSGASTSTGAGTVCASTRVPTVGYLCSARPMVPAALLDAGIGIIGSDAMSLELPRLVRPGSFLVFSGRGPSGSPFAAPFTPFPE